MAKTILIIDDEKDMRTYLSTLFQTAGYETRTATNGEEGLALALESPPDLITLDVLMPKKSGVRAYRELRTADTTRGVPIVILTGLTQREDLFGEDLGDIAAPDAMVEKPIDREAFIQQVQGILGG